VGAANWGLDRINQASLPLDSRPLSTGSNNGAGVNVYVLDTGIRLTHEQFGGRAKAGAGFVNDGNGVNDCNGHGTHVAGTVAGSSSYY
jgi:subtilisin family serine protease